MSNGAQQCNPDQDTLKGAIRDGLVVTFTYKGKPQVALPVTLGVHAGSALIAWSGYVLRDGEPMSGQPDLFRLSGTHNLAVTPDRCDLPEGHDASDGRFLFVFERTPVQV